MWRFYSSNVAIQIIIAMCYFNLQVGLLKLQTLQTVWAVWNSKIGVIELTTMWSNCQTLVNLIFEAINTLDLNLHKLLKSLTIEWCKWRNLTSERFMYM